MTIRCRIDALTSPRYCSNHMNSGQTGTSKSQIETIVRLSTKVSQMVYQYLSISHTRLSSSSMAFSMSCSAFLMAK